MATIQNDIAKGVQIHLNDVRGRHKMDGFRSFHTFNFGNYQSEHRQPFGNLYVLNDDTLAGGRSVDLQIEECTQVLLLPVVGNIISNNTFVGSGEILAMDLAAGSNIRITNPYTKEEDLVNFIQLWFSTPGTLRFSSSVLHSFSFDDQSNCMIDLRKDPVYPAISIGKYRSRRKDVYEIKDPSKGLYAFVIQGAFEVEDRLLHERDGLALQGYDSIEFESLSNDAILLLVETATKK